MTILTSITPAYLEKSKPFFESAVQYWPGKRVCFTIGFAWNIEGWECIETPQPECKWQPKNRNDYASLQHGEWTNYYKAAPKEMMLFIDSDMVLQREWDLDFPYKPAMLVTPCSYPPLTLGEVVKNLKCKRRPDKFFDKYRCVVQREFCAAFLLAPYHVHQELYLRCRGMYDMLKDFEHHAAWQLLINIAISNNMKSFTLPAFICNADWYEGTAASISNGELWCDNVQAGDQVSSEKVYFNHTKFN